MNRQSRRSFVAGAAASAVVVAAPAAALVAADAEAPTVFDRTTPALTLDPPKFVVGGVIDATTPPEVNDCGMSHVDVPMKLTWHGGDTGSGLAGYDVWEEGSWNEPHKAVEGTTATEFRFSGGNYDSDCGGGNTDYTYWVGATDLAGNSALTAHVSEVITPYQQDGVPLPGGWVQAGDHLPLARSGTWSTSSCTCSDGGSTLYSTSAGASLTYTIDVESARTVGLVMGKNTNRGVVKISVDGATPVSVDTYATSAQSRVIVWQRTFGAGEHTLQLTNAATAGRPRIDVDAILMTR